MDIKDKVELATMYVEAGDSYREAIDKIKAQYPNTTKDKGHDKTINEIIPHENNIDNGEVYNLSNGETIKDLI
ncbi:MAG: hypothetical protein E7214_08195 [Clostridium sp.]|nr:hypothetical protein [Clostridium sp.]